MLCCTKSTFLARKVLSPSNTFPLMQPTPGATPEIAQIFSCLAPNSISFARGGSAKTVLSPPQPISCLQRLIPCRYYAINSPRTDQGTHHAAQGLLHRSSGTNCRRATAVGILSTLLAGVIAGMAMPPERHAAQPHPWLGGCRAQHPSTPTTQESLLGKLPFN